MASFHVNPDTGRANQCTAKVKCPFGDLTDDHFATKVEAREAYEKTMSEDTVAPVLKKSTSNVVSLTAVRESKASAKADDLSAVRKESEFDEQVEKLPRHLVTAAEFKAIQNVAAGKKVSAEKLDGIILKLKKSATKDAYNDLREVNSSKGVMTYLKAVRSQDATPSTIKTLETFDPARETTFSNSRARENAIIAGKAIRREAAHAEWMYKLSQEAFDEVKFGRTHEDDPTSADYLASATKYKQEALESEARVQAQLREIQYLHDTDEEFAKSSNSDVRRMLTKGYFRPKASSFDGLYIGNTKEVK